MYRRNEKTNRVIIDIALETHMSFFHTWDNSPIRRRDIHAELAQFLDLCSDDIPLRKKIEIVFTVEEDPRNEIKEQQIVQSYQNYYSSQHRLEKRQMWRIVRTAVLLLLIALLLLVVYGMIIDVELTNLAERALRESLLIGGWVFTWEAVHLFFIDNFRPILREREIKRFRDADLTFVYKLEK